MVIFKFGHLKDGDPIEQKRESEYLRLFQPQPTNYQQRYTKNIDPTGFR